MSEPEATAPPAPPVDHSAVFDRARELVAAKLEIDRLNALVAEQKTIKDAAEAYLLEAFANEPDLGGLQVSGYTIYTRRQSFTNAEDKAAAYDALIAAGLDDYAQRTFNATSVSALFREWEANGEEPPAELAGLFKTSDTYKIGMTKSGDKSTPKKRRAASAQTTE